VVGVAYNISIGPDVAPFWTNWISRRLLRDRHGVSTLNAIRNVLTRAFMHRRLWLNDPDCLMARVSETELSTDEVQTLASVIGLSDGMFVLSDNLAALPDERRTLIETAFDLLGGWPEVADLFERDPPEVLRAT